MRLFLDNKEITLEELEHRLNNWYVSDSSYEIVELVDIDGDNLYFAISCYGIYS